MKAQAQSGQAVVELVVIVPLLLLLMLGAVDFGRYVHDGIEVGNAARAGVQYGAQSVVASTDTTGIIAAAQSDAPDIAGLSITASNYCTCDKAAGTQYAGCTGMPSCASSDHRDIYVAVVATRTFTPLVPYPGVPNPLLISRTASQQVTP